MSLPVPDVTTTIGESRKAKVMPWWSQRINAERVFTVVRDRRVLSHASHENTQSFARRSQQNTLILAGSRGIVRRHCHCDLATRDGRERIDARQFRSRTLMTSS